ncbi:flavonol 4'-sulfotransferase-like [Rutidosis leptorrhynchoides]|uniref:flavonol 4'-sulfotransferase-like n=1 Tax=Rutidosis leptorrhynchoides TaxID=125765 RepID=UPI003A992096
MEDKFEKLPQHSISWLKGRSTWYKNQGFWTLQKFHIGAIMAQQRFKVQPPSDTMLCSFPKSGTTWLKALSFAILTRHKFDESTTPLLTTFPHDFVPNLDVDLEKIEANGNNDSHDSSPLMFSSHLPYTCLPESIISSNCKIVYVYRNVKDVIVSHYHFLRELFKVPIEDAPFEEAFEEFCQGISAYGPYWEHILGFWKASLERPGTILFLKYEDLKRDPTTHVKALAEFLGNPFSDEEVGKGAVESIINLCSFERLKNLDVNKTGLRHNCERKSYFRKAKVGDWENYFTNEMKEKIDNIIHEKLSGVDLVLK